MKKSLIIFLLFMISISVRSQNDSDTLGFEPDYYSSFYAGSSLSIMKSFTSSDLVIGYTYKKIVGLEYELGRMYSSNNNWTNRLMFKIYPLERLDYGHSLIIGLGIHHYNISEKKNGIFSRFQGDYFQELNYTVDSKVTHYLLLLGLQEYLSNSVFMEISSTVGVGKRNAVSQGVPEDARYRGNGSYRLFSQSSVDGELLSGIIGIKILVAYEF